MDAWIKKQLREAEVTDAGRHVLTKKNIARLEITMYDRWYAAAVEIVQRVGDVHGNVEPLDCGQAANILEIFRRRMQPPV
jgi:hypothetical protein